MYPKTLMRWVDGNHHNVTALGQRGTVVHGGAAGSPLVGTAMDPHHDRNARGLFRTPDVEEQAIFAALVVRVQPQTCIRVAVDAGRTELGRGSPPHGRTGIGGSSRVFEVSSP